ncbi:Lytic transglycosylase catalytic [Gluconacetobacter diazotrophicus PA1 5]|uniref:lytic transglycosylase domain-containing protein n=1 Tax=Gluconacetobacter diazotrophicus TaxID=33996 RepID=UPI000173B66B|nr:lytic transglycosylase domain-containing protein [Gluconacetobacter diazotrophicus]ACI52536.1 Lytic transglycosylase catalytic [Gluconacetobacter diazotrophicus PA1 5]
MRRALLLLASVTAFGVSAVAVHAQTAPIDLHAPSDPYAALIAEAAQRFAIPTAWIRAIMRMESRGDRHAVSPKGAMGLMQLMPETWAALRVRYGLGRDPFDPHDNLLAGAAFLREMHDRYGSPGFLAAYNAGPGRYEDYRDRRRPLPAETVAYVAALVPFVGDGVTDGPALVVASDPSSWTQAPLFIMRSASAEPAGRATLKPQPNDTPTVVAVRDVSAIAPQSGGLFVPVSASGPQR